MLKCKCVCIFLSGVQHTLQLAEQMKERLEEEIVQLNREKAELFEQLGGVSLIIIIAKVIKG